MDTYSFPAVLVLEGLGDRILSLPTLRCLASLFPNRLTVLTAGASTVRLLSPIPFRRVINCPLKRIDYLGRTVEKPAGTLVIDPPGTAAALGQCDLFISLLGWFCPIVEELLDIVRPERCVGIARSKHWQPEVIRKSLNQHEAEAKFAIASMFGPGREFGEFAYALTIPEEECGSARSILDILPRGSRVLAVHMDTAEEKEWPSEKWRACLDMFLARNRDFYAVIVGRREFECNSSMEWDRIIPCHNLPFMQSIALVSLSDVFVGIDSCMLHAADMCRIPSVGLFGPTNAKKWGSLLTKYIAIQAAGDMNDINVDIVLDAIENAAHRMGDSVLWEI